jgi:hypothetical protein
MLAKRKQHVSEYFESLEKELIKVTEQALVATETQDDSKPSKAENVKFENLEEKLIDPLLRKSAIMEKQDQFLAELKQFETLNLNHLETLDNLVDDSNVCIYKHFCFFVNKNYMRLSHLNEIDASFGYLFVLTDEYIPPEEMAIFSENLKSYDYDLLSTNKWSLTMVCFFFCCIIFNESR